jgi:hypothetical protein
LNVSSLQRDPLTPRLRHVLRVLDGSLAGASFQDIARTVSPAEFSTEGWLGRAGGMRDRIRRALRRGCHLMKGG